MSSPNTSDKPNNRRPKKFGVWPSAGKLQFILDSLNNLDALPVEPKLSLHESLVKNFGEDRVAEFQRNAKLKEKK